MHRKLLAAPVVAGLLLVLAAGPAMAMDCFVVNRSTTGTIQAANSSQWIDLTVTGDFLGLPPGGPCATAINNALTAAGLPTVIASRSDKILLANLPAARSSILTNGTGVDHLDVSPVTGAIISVVETVFSTNPACGA